MPSAKRLAKSQTLCCTDEAVSRRANIRAFGIGMLRLVGN